MAHLIKERDIQAGLNQAWHNLTTIVDEVKQDNSMPFEVVESPIYYKKQEQDYFGVTRDVYVEDPEFKILLANDDWLPIGDPYASSYQPSSIKMFWEVIKKGMGQTPYQIVSAGTVDNRRKLFASLKVTEGFEVAGRKFEDFITVLDSFDKTTALTARYLNFCTVCNNTFMASMTSGKEIGKAKHTQMLEVNVARLIDAIDGFAGTSNLFQSMLERAHEKECSRDEAKAWAAGVQGRNMEKGTNALVQKAARIGELFESGRGNEGRTRLDAFQALTEFETHESSNRKEAGAQNYSSNWGASALTKTIAAQRFEIDWDTNVKRGNKLLESAVALAN
jgi:hypothetical protein